MVNLLCYSYEIVGLKTLPCKFLYPHQFNSGDRVNSDDLRDFLRPLQLIQEEDQCILWPYHTAKLDYYWVGVQFVLSWIGEQLKVINNLYVRVGLN
jgi:hypothetical protein